MLKKCAFGAAVLLCLVGLAGADTVRLKDQSAITGKVLAEKREQIFVDIGYTVLAVPRAQILKITKSGDEPGEVPVKAKPGRGTKAEPEPLGKNVAAVETQVQPQVSLAPSAPGKPGLYSVATRPLSARSVKDLVNELGEAVVQVRTPSALGSGFLINEEGFLLTNFHVIEGETQISVEVFHRGAGELRRQSYKQLRIIALNKFADLALLKIDDKDAPRFKFVLQGNSDALAVGDGVFAIGSPLGLERTVTEGILSTKTRPMAGELFLQTTAQINPGNSGGPLFNLRGEVVGITNMKITFSEGLGFAIPIESVKYFIEHREAFAYGNDNPSNAYRYLEPPSRTRKALTEE